MQKSPNFGILEAYVVSDVFSFEVKTHQISQKVTWFLCSKSSNINIARLTKELFCIFDEFAPQNSVNHLIQILQESRKC